MTRPQYLQDVPPGRADAHPGTHQQKGKTMNNKTKGVIAGIAGLALLGGGTTFALWTDSAVLSGATITNGNLDVTADADGMSWRDVSIPSSSEAIDEIADWLMVPGDVLEGTQDLSIAINGDNLVADLLVTRTAATEPLPEGVTATYELLDSDDVQVVGPIAVGTGTPLPLSPSDSGDYTLVVTVAFDDEISGQVSANSESHLDTITVSLTQDR